MIEEKKRKRKLLSKAKQMNMTMIKVGSSMLKKHKLFLVMLLVTESYRLKILHFLLILAFEIVLT